MTAMPAAAHVLEHNLLVYRRTWRGSLFTTFLAPVLFLLAMGVGLGQFVDQSSANAFDGVSYLVFLAPGLLVSTAMQTAAGESMYPVMSALTWQRTFHAAIATPVRSLDIVTGQLLWLVVRLGVVSGAFAIVMVPFGAADLPHALAMVPIAVITGLAFAMPIQAFSATQRKDNVFAVLNRFIIIPLFLFSGIFFPVTQLPWFLQPIAYATPLWHGVSLARQIAIGPIDLPLAALNLAVIGAYIGVGFAAAALTFRRRLEQ
jgi:lipooligosaccharide transport system permease protein